MTVPYCFRCRRPRTKAAALVRLLTSDPASRRNRVEGGQVPWAILVCHCGDHEPARQPGVQDAWACCVAKVKTSLLGKSTVLQIRPEAFTLLAIAFRGP